MLTVDIKEKSLGTLKFGESYKFTYSLKNEYTHDITIDKIVLGCNSCTKANADKTKLDKGESTLLNVEFTPGSTGVNSKSISVLYSGNGVKNANLHLKFKAIVNG